MHKLLTFRLAIAAMATPALAKKGKLGNRCWQRRRSCGRLGEGKQAEVNGSRSMSPLARTNRFASRFAFDFTSAPKTAPPPGAPPVGMFQRILTVHAHITPPSMLRFWPCE
ncbi:MAG: hypothetical protein KA154_17985 [Gemmatimonadaceae bacterium]|nr:hypothetical protein [Gemmatimonadaceae bacterium]